MYAPHVFHGTSTDVTVPESSTARDSTCGASPRRSNSPVNMRAGSTSATYWEPAMTASPRRSNSPVNMRAGSTSATYWSPRDDVEADTAAVDRGDQTAAVGRMRDDGAEDPLEEA